MLGAALSDTRGVEVGCLFRLRRRACGFDIFERTQHIDAYRIVEFTIDSTQPADQRSNPRRVSLAVHPDIEHAFDSTPALRHETGVMSQDIADTPGR